MNQLPTKFFLPESWLSSCRVLVIGCGGTGCEVVDALVRLHYSLIGCGGRGLSMWLQDGDTVSAANVGRQRFLHSDVGANKAQTLARRYGLLYSIPISYSTTKATARSMREFSDFDLVITAVDRADFRVRMGRYWRGRKTRTMWLDSGNGAYTGQVVLGHLGKPPAGMLRLPNVFDLYPALDKVIDDASPSCSLPQALARQRLGVNYFMAGAAIYAVLSQLFLQGSIEHHGAFVDMSKPSVRPLKIDPAAWSFLQTAKAA